MIQQLAIHLLEGFVWANAFTLQLFVFSLRFRQPPTSCQGLHGFRPNSLIISRKGYVAIVLFVAQRYAKANA